MNVHKLRVKLPREVEVRVWELDNGNTQVDVGGMQLWSTDEARAAELVEELEETDDALAYLLMLVEELTEKAALDGRITA